MAAGMLVRCHPQEIPPLAQALLPDQPQVPQGPFPVEFVIPLPSAKGKLPWPESSSRCLPSWDLAQDVRWRQLLLQSLMMRVSHPRSCQQPCPHRVYCSPFQTASRRSAHHVCFMWLARTTRQLAQASMIWSPTAGQTASLFGGSGVVEMQGGFILAWMGNGTSEALPQQTETLNARRATSSGIEGTAALPLTLSVGHGSVGTVHLGTETQAS
mmetsp:Transcript_129685/g.336386  ORF Transcript_129685/g.336386 Transcript_129685/m.336386 type:complete len:213 (+) Transcript_129685:284-922(+)